MGFWEIGIFDCSKDVIFIGFQICILFVSVCEAEIVTECGNNEFFEKNVILQKKNLPEGPIVLVQES